MDVVHAEVCVWKLVLGSFQVFPPLSPPFNFCLCWGFRRWVLLQQSTGVPHLFCSDKIQHEFRVRSDGLSPFLCVRRIVLFFARLDSISLFVLLINFLAARGTRW